MKWNNVRNISYLISAAFHIFLAFLFYLISFNVEPDETDYVLVGFGTFGKNSRPAAVKKETVKKKTEKNEKKVEVPKAKNKDENEIAPVTKKKNKKIEKREVPKRGKEEIGEEEGNYGFSIDFGGKGRRKIYSYSLPEYPEGVQKEIDVKLRFTILPDGSVTNVFPLIKADARLEFAAINSLRQWRFEPLPKSKKQAAQNAIIVFPYRLR